MKKLGNWLGNIVLLLAGLLLLFVLIVPLVFSGRVAIVLSASMEPNMPMGALAITMPVLPEEVKVGDIIAFAPPWEPEVTVSHRVVEVLTDNGLHFSTKGDASEDIDPWVMPADYVTGRVAFNIPYLGYVANSALLYVRTWWGLIFLVALPSMLLIGGTVRGVARSANLREKRMNLFLKRHRRRR
jgi:signal peptidase